MTFKELAELEKKEIAKSDTDIPTKEQVKK